MALSVSGALTLVAGVSAAAAVLDLPILGFGETASEQAAPEVIHRTVYDDHYVTATTTPKAATRAPGAGASGSTNPQTPNPGGPAPTAGAAPVAAPAPAAAAAPAAAPSSGFDDPPMTSVPGGTIPPPPAGCREPEWDGEHQVWQCSGTESDRG